MYTFLSSGNFLTNDTRLVIHRLVTVFMAPPAKDLYGNLQK